MEKLKNGFSRLIFSSLFRDSLLRPFLFLELVLSVLHAKALSELDLSDFIPRKVRIKFNPCRSDSVLHFVFQDSW